MTAQFRTDAFPIYCRHCRGEIEACEGLFGDWMHTVTKHERCQWMSPGNTAEPEIAGDTRFERDQRARVNAANRGKKRAH